MLQLRKRGQPFCTTNFNTLYRQIVDHQDCLVKWLNHKIPTAILTREVEILKQLKNEHLVRFIRLESDGLGFGLVYEFMSQSLLDFLGNPQLSLNLELKKHWSVQISSGLEYLHSQEMVHRNLKPSNILLSLDLSQAKIADYGLGKLKSMSDVVIDSLYKSPELKQGRKHTCKSDIYALGLIMYELQTVKLIDDVVEPEDLESVSHLGLRKVLKQCLSPERETRPSCSDILQVLHTLPVNLKRTRQDTSLEPMRKRTLFEAVDDRDLSAVRRFLRSGVDVNQTDQDGATALYYAAASGQLHLCRQLLLRGADPNLQNRFGETPFNAAQNAGFLDVCRLILDSNADPLFEVAIKEMASDEMRQMMQGSDATLSFSDQESIDLVDSETVEEKQSEESELDVSENLDGRKLAQALFDAVENEDLKLCERYIKSGADVDLRSDQGISPLHVAAGSSNLEICQLLLASGAKVTRRAKNTCTPLHHASKNGHFFVCKALLEAGAVVDQKGYASRTALQMAVIHGDIVLCRYLIEKGANVNLFDNQGWSPLHLAACEGNLELCKLLLQKGADLQARSFQLYTPLHCAAKKGHLGICKYLIKKGINPYQKNKLGKSALDLALKGNGTDVSHFLYQFKEQ